MELTEDQKDDLHRVMSFWVINSGKDIPESLTDIWHAL